MITELAERKIEWKGGPGYFFTDDLPLPDVTYQGVTISLWVRLGRFVRPDETSLISQTYRYVVKRGNDILTDQRGLTLMHPDQAIQSSKRWIDKYL